MIFKNKTVLVTGGTKGVGEAVVTRLRNAGVKVLTTARSCGDHSGGEMFVAADVSSAEGCAKSQKSSVCGLIRAFL